MGLREVFNKNAAAVIIVCIVIIGAALFYVLWPADRKGTMRLSESVYFYNLNTGKLFATNRDTVPPIDTESGPRTGVKAVVVSCGGCGEEELKIAWLERWTPEGRKAYLAERERRKAAGQPLGGIRLGGLEIRSEQDEQWYPLESDQAGKIKDRIATMCDGQSARICNP